MTVTLRCLNCGFSFTVTYPSADLAKENARAVHLLPPWWRTNMALAGWEVSLSLAKENARAVTCGHCRSSQWAAQGA